MYRLDALKVWMLNQHIDITVIAETRWTYENEWTDDHFHYVHTAGHPSHTGLGILCVISRRFCRADQIKWRVVQPGRLIHIQLQQTGRSSDVVGCYQHTQATGMTRQQERAQWWRQLDDLLHGLVSRNVLVLTGDFNCSLPQAASHSGPGQYRWQRQLTEGVFHILRAHGLTALNTWNPNLGPTFVQATSHSRIDFAITRKHVADGIAKDVGYAWDAPFCSDARLGHAPILTQLRKQWYSPKSLAMGIRPQQRRVGHHAFSTNSQCWQQFVTETTEKLSFSLRNAQTSDEQFVPTLHDIATQCFQSHCPVETKRYHTANTTTDAIVMNKWNHRKQLLKLSLPNLKGCFKA